MFNIRISLCLAALTYASGLYACNGELYKGKPIDPLCFYDALSTGETIQPVHLDQCGIDHQDYRKVTGQNKELVRQGFTGYEYAWAMDRASTPTPGYLSYYKVIGMVGQQHVIQTINNSGGSGLFSSLILVDRHDDTLTLKVLASGDRCFKGIVDAKLENQKLIYRVNLTPEDLLKLSPRHAKQKDAASCATCCAGTAEYVHDFSKPAEADQLRAVRGL